MRQRFAVHGTIYICIIYDTYVAESIQPSPEHDSHARDMHTEFSENFPGKSINMYCMLSLYSLPMFNLTCSAAEILAGVFTVNLLRCLSIHHS